ncbi:hypothetical protein SAMN05216388_103823 [Halorientalis persicus]|uniref:Uncharacterized protein n=1 Tax=Halorientalis persicus TaxID=1367881 RepID=A0A1H8VJ09_9EURY|nr:hypothetical protein SAMN05216388_103823 [Halorientalis persicus]
MMGDVDLDVVETQLAQAYTRALEPVRANTFTRRCWNWMRRCRRGSRNAPDVGVWACLSGCAITTAKAFLYLNIVFSASEDEYYEYTFIHLPLVF